MNTAYFLYRLVDAIPGLDEMFNRKLCFRATHAIFYEDSVELYVAEDKFSDKMLSAGKSYIVETEIQGESTYRYYYFKAFETLVEEGKIVVKLYGELVDQK